MPLVACHPSPRRQRQQPHVDRVISVLAPDHRLGTGPMVDVYLTETALVDG